MRSRLRSPWRYFPLAIVAGLGLVVVVNGAMVFAALSTLPGQSGEGFALSNQYDAVLAEQQRESALGWRVSALTDTESRPVVVLSGPDGVPLHDAVVTGVAQRPLGEPRTRKLVFVESETGRYIADVVLPLPGQWELTLSASAEGHEVAVTRRVIVH